MPKVTMIPASVDPATHIPNGCSGRKRKAAAYARVSTDEEEQLTSYEAQVDYYTKKIKANPEWEFVKVYTDEGVTGTNTKKREGFKSMMADALSGKIDLILTKSVSRFARNTVDTLTNIRKLKDKGIEVYFEKENIWTLDSKGELLITIMSSLAQEESRSISENVTWGQRKSFSDGKIHLAYSKFLGYRKGADGRPEIVPEEAETVRGIYSAFIAGATPHAIALSLTSEGKPTPAGKRTWGSGTVLSILTNEKYKGDALLQKSYTTDFLQHKTKRNDGEVPQYYVENSHPAIIQPDEWNSVQAELERRRGLGSKYSGGTEFMSKLVCGDCGSAYGPKVWHSTDQYRKTVWQCNGKFKGGTRCSTPTLTEDAIKSAFVRAYNSAMSDREGVVADLEAMRDALFDTASIDARIKDASQAADDLLRSLRALVDGNKGKAQDQAEYLASYGRLDKKYEEQNAALSSLRAEKEDRSRKADQVTAVIAEYSKAGGTILAWDARLWALTLDKATVNGNGTITFSFKGGRSSTQKAE